MATPYVDMALAYDPTTRRCDCVFDGADFVLDDTPATPLLVAIGVDRRAHPDDVVLNMPADPSRPSTLNARRGWPGDALDPQGRFSGSRIWVFRDQKQTETVRRSLEGAAAEALDFFESERGMAVALSVTYPTRNQALLQVDVAGTQAALTLGAGA